MMKGRRKISICQYVHNKQGRKFAQLLQSSVLICYVLYIFDLPSTGTTANHDPLPDGGNPNLHSQRVYILVVCL